MRLTAETPSQMAGLGGALDSGDGVAKDALGRCVRQPRRLSYFSCLGCRAIQTRSTNRPFVAERQSVHSGQVTFAADSGDTAIRPSRPGGDPEHNNSLIGFFCLILNLGL